MQKINEISHPEKIKSPDCEIGILIGCGLCVSVLCYAQIRGSSILIAACLLGFLLFHVWSCCKDKTLFVLLFFLPWSPLLKLDNGGISFFTIALMLSCVIYFWKNNFSFDVYQIMLAGLLVGVTLTAKVLQANSVANSYLCFLVMLLLFPCVVKVSATTSDFWELTVFFACGIITAALSAQRVANYPNISQYIRVDSYLAITRLSGYYSDPNFYSAHITACLSGIQLLLSQEKKRYRQFILVVLSIVLIYCGLLSASKSFVLVATCLFLVWIPLLLEKGNRSGKFGLFMGLLCAGLIILSSSAFQDLFRIVDDRFSYASNVSELTTGRTELWRQYVNEFTHNAPLTLLGEGYTSVTLDGRASHNTIIQGIYQLGIIGFPLLWMWMYFTLKNIFRSSEAVMIRWKCVVLMCIGVVLPWMALDILFFDEFFLLPVYAAIGIAYASYTQHATS